MRKIILILCLFLGMTPAFADGELDKLLSDFDKDRLARFDAISTEALDEAHKGGAAADIVALDEALSGTPLSIEQGFDATGNWRCRIIKAGGMLPLVVYPEFKCAISDDGAGWFLKKLSGSQRTQGRFYTTSATRLIYVGAGHVAGEKPRRYGEDPKEDQVAVVERRAENRLLLMFPAPHYESKLDIMVLER
jgi:hypothetical protein